MDPGQIVAAAEREGADYCDVRVERTRQRRILWKDGSVEALTGGAGTGFALRVLVGGAWGFAAGSDGWREAVRDAVAAARRTTPKEPVRLQDTPVTVAREEWKPRIDPLAIDVEDQVALLRAMEARVRGQEGIHAVETRFSAGRTDKEYADSEGRSVRWGLTRTVAQAHFTARRDGELAGRHTRVGATKGWEVFAEEDPVEKCQRAAEATVAALGAPPAKGGRRTVVVDHELAGVFAHEAVGHASEADLVRAGESCLRGRIGDRIGIEGLTVRDDARWRGAFGAYPFDDEGSPAQDRVLVQDGVFVGYLADRENAAYLDVPANGAARAQDHMSRPLVRMSTTLIDAGDHTEEEVFEGIKDGIYCKGSRGGQVDTARGTYLFNAQEAYRIVDGEVREPLRDVSLTGSILETLHAIEALGDTQRLGDPGYCGKGQWVPVCDGGPLVRIADCLVGGAG